MLAKTHLAFGILVTLILMPLLNIENKILFVILVYISIGEKEKLFSAQDVIKKISGKMITRHPHVFSDKELKTPQEVLNHWHKLKDEERKDKNISNDQSGNRKAIPGRR